MNEINNGKYYNARFDKSHVANLIINYEFNKKYEISANFVYNTGAPFTSSSTSYNIQGTSISQNPDNVRNNARLPAYHRLDLSFTIHGDKTKNNGKKKWLIGDWVFSAYNVYARKNAFTVYFDPATNQAIKYSIIATIVPSITYNFKF